MAPATILLASTELAASLSAVTTKAASLSVVMAPEAILPATIAFAATLSVVIAPATSFSVVMLFAAMLEATTLPEARMFAATMLRSFHREPSKTYTPMKWLDNGTSQLALLFGSPSQPV